MRRRNRYNNRYNNKEGILLAEFRFYNNKKKIIDDDILKKLRDEIKSKERNEIYWTNDEFAKHSVGFKFFLQKMNNDDEEEEVYISILKFGTLKFTTEEFNKAKYIYDKTLFLSYEPTDEQKELLGALDNYNDIFSEYKTEKLDKMLNSWEDTVNFMIKNKLLSIMRRKEDWENFLGDTKILFGDKIKMEWKPNLYEVSRSGYSSVELYEIQKVIEYRIDDKNYRVALITRIDYYNDNYFIEIIREDDEDYLYIDEGYMYMKVNNKKYFIDNTLKEYRNVVDEKVVCNEDGSYKYDDNGHRLYEKIVTNKLYVNFDIFSSMKNNINEIMSSEQKVISPMIYRFYKERVGDRGESRDIFSEREMAIIEQYKKILEQGKEIRVNNTIISKTKIEVDGHVFKMEFKEDFINVVEKFGSIKKLLNSDDVRYNFNNFYEGLLKLSKLDILRMENTRDTKYKEFEEQSFKLNDMEIIVSKENSRIKINDVFSRIDDVFYILSKVICYRDINSFNTYVKEVSYIGIEWKKMISNGIALELHNPVSDLFKLTDETGFEKMLMRFSMVWDPNKRTQIHLKLNDSLYLIKYKNKFKKNFNYPRRTLSLETLWIELKECIEDISDDDILEIVNQAIDEAKIVKERGLELVKLTIKEVKAEDTKINIGGQEIEGYKITGRLTKSEYFIQKGDLSVYKFVEGKWNRRCVVDDHTKQRIYEDRLANRLVNIYNEPKKIFTLHNI